MHDRRTVEVCGPHKGDVDPEVPMVGRAVEAEIDPKRYRRPCWILLPTVEADLQREASVKCQRLSQGAYPICWFRLQFFEDLERLGFCRKSAHIASDIWQQGA
jgi:hypothetical protein